MSRPQWMEPGGLTPQMCETLERMGRRVDYTRRDLIEWWDPADPLGDESVAIPIERLRFPTEADRLRARLYRREGD